MRIRCSVADDDLSHGARAVDTHRDRDAAALLRRRAFVVAPAVEHQGAKAGHGGGRRSFAGGAALADALGAALALGVVLGVGDDGVLVGVTTATDGAFLPVDGAASVGTSSADAAAGAVGAADTVGAVDATGALSHGW